MLIKFKFKPQEQLEDKHGIGVSTFLPSLNASLFYRGSFSPSRVKQAELAKQHTKFVLMLNQTLEEKATATSYINDTYARINFEREEISLQKQCLREANELMERHKVEYFEKKNELAAQVRGRAYSV